MSPIIEKAKKHCSKLLEKSRCFFLPFHNYDHTLEVYRNVKKIGVHENLTEEELEPLLIAALFHDTGNASAFREHEKVSAINAQLFLKSEDYPQNKIVIVVNSIMATRIPQTPKNIYQQIVCDADLFHLGSSSFFWKNRLIRKEWAQYLNVNYSDAEWYDLNIDFLKTHSYCTAYGRNFLQPVKQKNIEILESLLATLEKV